MMHPSSAVLQLPPPPDMWLGVPAKTYCGSLDAVRARIPRFERRPFRAVPAPGRTAGFNDYADMIVRVPQAGEPEIPVGIVSKTYRLIQHDEVLEAAANALRDAGVPLADTEAELRLTTNGERMALKLTPSNLDKYRFEVSKDDVVGLCVACFNSVEGSTRFEALLGWFRYVCSNGLIVGTTVANLRRWHTAALRIEDITDVVKAGMEIAATERAEFDEWRRHTVSDGVVRRWVDGPVTERWGVKAAARAWHICHKGRDAIIAPFTKGPASEAEVTLGRNVPGALSPARDAFAVAQALSWLAGQRREIPEQVQWMKETPELVKRLIELS